jgi:hypothetical protein
MLNAQSVQIVLFSSTIHVEAEQKEAWRAKIFLRRPPGGLPAPLNPTFSALVAIMPE